jgi:septal ring factor EnvC (AmiA/AmiB activator)
MSIPTATPRTDDGLLAVALACEYVKESVTLAGSDMREHAADIRRVLAELAAAKAECAAKQAAFDLMFSANLRGIKMWQDAHPEHSETWPDLAKLVAWLLSELARLRAENEQLKADVTRETTVCDTACMEAQRLRAEVERLKDNAFHAAMKP